MDVREIFVPAFTNNKNLEKRDKKSPEFVVKTFLLANDYRELAHKLRTMQSDTNSLPSPIAMLFAFSCELFLKALIKFCNENGKAHGHELKKLFQNVNNEEIKEIMRNVYNEKFGNDEQTMDSSLNNIFPVGFEDTLARFNEAFEYLRYENEYVELWADSAFLPWFADTLYMICEQKQLRKHGI